jgi:hypothetical protein
MCCGHGRRQGGRVRAEGQSPLPQEGDAESDEEDSADAAGRKGFVPPADDHLGHARNVGGGRSGQEAHQHRLVQRDARQDQQSGGGHERSDGYLAAVTHVTHGTNHP